MFYCVKKSNAQHSDSNYIAAIVQRLYVWTDH